MPWEHEGGEGKYSYHPGRDTRNAPKDAPSAINVVVVPDVTLPKVNISSFPVYWRLAARLLSQT